LLVSTWAALLPHTAVRLCLTRPVTLSFSGEAEFRRGLKNDRLESERLSAMCCSKAAKPFTIADLLFT